MRTKLLLLVSAVASALSFNAQSTPTTVASGNNLKIVAEDVFEFGQLFNSPTVAITDERAIYANKNGYIVTADINENNELSIASSQKLINAKSAQFSISDDGQNLLYVANVSDGSAMLYASEWDSSTSQWTTPVATPAPNSAAFPTNISIEGNLIAIAFADVVQFFQWNNSPQSVEYLSEFSAPGNVKVHAVNDSQRFFIENAPASANGVLGTLVEVNGQSGTIADIASITLSSEANTQFLKDGVYVYFDSKNNVAALSGKGYSSSFYFYRFADTQYELVPNDTLPSEFEGINTYQNGVLFEANSFASQRDIYLVSNGDALSFEKIGNRYFPYDTNLHVANNRAFSDNFAATSLMSSRSVIHFTIDRAGKTFSQERYYLNGKLEPLSLSGDDYYQPTKNTNNHWLIFPHDRHTYLLDEQAPANVIAEADYDILKSWGGSHPPSAKYFTFRETLFAFLLPTNGISHLFHGRYSRINIDQNGNFSNKTHDLADVTPGILPFVQPFPIPSLNGIAVLDPSRVLFYRFNENEQLQHVATRGGDFRNNRNDAQLMDDGLGILFVSKDPAEVKRLVLSGNELVEQAVSFDVAPPLSRSSTVSAYGAYLSIYAGGQAPYDTHTYRRNEDGDYELYFTGNVPCDCVFDKDYRFTETQAFEVKDGKLRYYELDLSTKSWSLAETLNFAEDLDIQGLQKDVYFGKSSSAVRKYSFAVKPGIAGASAYEYSLTMSETLEVDVSSYFEDVNTGDTLVYTLVSQPGYVSLSGSALQIKPTPQSNNSAVFQVQARDSSGFERQVSVSVAINKAPIVKNLPPKLVEKLALVTGTLKDNVEVGHPSGGSLSFTTASDSALPVSLHGDYSGNFSSYGTFRIKATAADELGLSAAVEQTVIVNAKPVARDLAQVVITQGETYSGSLANAVSDDDGDQLRFKTASNSVLTVAEDGSFSGVLAERGQFYVSAHVTDEIGQIATVTQPVLVNAAPVVVSRPAILVTPNTNVSGSLSDNVSDVDSTTLTFVATEDSNLPVSPNGDFSGAFSAAGSYTVKARVSDEHGASTIVEQSIIVNGLPVFTTPVPIWVNPNQAVNGDFSTMVTDPEGKELTFTTVQGSALDVSPNGMFSGSFQSAGTYEIKAIAKDTAGSTIQVVQLVRVNAAPVALQLNDVAINPNDMVSVNIAAAFSDADDHALNITANNLPDGITLSASGLLTGRITEEGEYTMSFTATDPLNLSASIALTIRVTKTAVRTRPETTQWRGKNVLITATTLHQDGIYEGTETVAVGANRILNFEDSFGKPFFGQAIISEINADGSISAVGGQSLPNLTSAKPRLFNNGNTLAYIGYVQAEFRNALYISNWNGATKRWDEPSWMIIDGLQGGRVDDFQLDIQGDTVALAIGDSTNFSVSVYTRDTQSNALTLVKQVPSSEVGKQVSDVTLLPDNNQLMVTLASSQDDTDTTQARLYSIDKQAKTITQTARVQLSDDEQSFAHVATTKHWFDAVTNTYFYYAPQSTLTNKFVAYRLNTEGKAYERLANSVFPDYLIEIVGVKDGIFVGRHSTNDTRAFTLSTDSGLSFRRMAEVPYEFGKALTDGLVGDSWGMVRSSYGATVYTINKDQSRIRFKKRYVKGQVGAPQLGDNNEFVSLFRAKNRVIHLKDSKELVQLNNDEAATSHIRFSYDLNGFSSTTVPVEFQELGGYFYSLYNGVSYGTTVSVSYMKIYADSNGNLTRRVEYLRDKDGEIVNLNVFKFYPAPSMGGMILHTADKMTFYKQQINGNLVYESELTSDFPLSFGDQQLLDDGRGITYWDRNVRRLDRLVLDEQTKQLKLIKAPYRIATPGTPAYADNGRLNFLFYIGGTPRTNMYVLNEAGIYERKFVGRAPCDCVVKAETLFTPNRGYGFVKGDNVVSIYDLNPSTYEWTTSDTIPFSESIEHFDKDTKIAYGRIGSWLRQYTFQSAPALTKTPEAIVLAQDESRTIDLSGYFRDADDNEQHTITIDNLPQGATFNGTQLTLTGSSAINGMKLTVKVTDLQDFVLTFELPISVNPAVEVNTAADTEQTVALRNKPTVLPLTPQLSSIGTRFSGSLAEGVIDTDGGNLVFSTAEGSDFVIQADGSYTDEIYAAANYTASAMVTDQHGQTVTVSQRVIVNAAPDVDAMPELVFEAGENISGSLANVVSDANGDVLIFTSAADSALPVAANGQFTGVLSAGSYQLKGTVSDIHGEVVEYVQHIHVVAKSGKADSENANASNTNTSGSLNNSASLTSSSSQSSSSGGLLWLVGLLPFVKRSRNKKRH